MYVYVYNCDGVRISMHIYIAWLRLVQPKLELRSFHVHSIILCSSHHLGLMSRTRLQIVQSVLAKRVSLLRRKSFSDLCQMNSRSVWPELAIIGQHGILARLPCLVLGEKFFASHRIELREKIRRCGPSSLYYASVYR